MQTTGSVCNETCADKSHALKFRVHIVQELAELEALKAPWNELSREAEDPNIFYEPCLLIPALHQWSSERNLFFLFLFGANPANPEGASVLYGMFPFEKRKQFRGLPCSVFRLLKLPFTRLCTPLVRKYFVQQTVKAVLDWLETCPQQPSLVEFRYISGDSRFSSELHQQTMKRHCIVYQSELSIRALLKPLANAQLYFDQVHSLKHGRKEWRRLENRLFETGKTEYRVLRPEEDVAPWIEAFLNLEKRGWKGQQGTALALKKSEKYFFEEALKAAHQQGKLMMAGLFLDDKAIALKVNFLSNGGAFAFKIAYDEQFAKYSPGVLLELENIRLVHAMPQLFWMDSTADSEHFMINRLWMDRRSIETFLVSPGKTWGNFIAAIFPLLRWLKPRSKLYERE